MTVVVAAAGALGRLLAATAPQLMSRGNVVALEGHSAAPHLFFLSFCLSFFLQFSFSGSFH